MRLNDLKKTYSQLSQLELAALAFDATVNRDDKELTAIIECVPKVPCLINVGIKYQEYYRKLFNLSLIYGVLYWQTVSHIYSSGANNEAFLCQLGAIDQALVTVCDKFNLNIDTIRSLAQCRNNKIQHEKVNQDMLIEYTDAFMSFFV